MATIQEPQGKNTPLLWIAVFAVAGMAVVCLAAISNNGAPDTNRNVLTVSGTHVIEVAPDQAVLMVGVLTNDSTAQGASSENSAILQRVIAALTAQGIAAADIETTSVYLNKNQEWDYKNQVYLDRGYQQTTMLKVTVKKLDMTGAVLDAAVAAGANQVQDISFELQSQTEERYKQQALTDATKVATTKAQVLASAAGTRLGDVTNIAENSYNYVPYMYNTKQIAADGAGAPTPISPQKVTLSVSVTVSYELK